jgi:glycosyltransferase involved in cell wall biosynthesis
MKLINNPLVSIVINCYNGEKYLRQSIESILDQSYQNLELIFWDNHSTDQSKNIIKSYDDKRIKYFFSQNHSTLYQARNLALKECKGDFISFLDVDDYYLKDRIVKQLLHFKDQKVGVTYSNYYRYYEDINKKKLLTNKMLPSGNLTKYILEESQISFMTVMIRKKSLESLQFNFDQKYSIIGDYDLLYRLSFNWDFYYIKEPLAVYRIHDDNFSKNSILFIDELKDWYNKNYSSFANKKNYIYKKIIFFQALEYSSKKNILKFFKEFWKYPMSFDKIKLLLIMITPNFVLKCLKNFKKK